MYMEDVIVISYVLRKLKRLVGRTKGLIWFGVPMVGQSGPLFDVANCISIALELRECRIEVPSIVLIGVYVPDILTPSRQSYWIRRRLGCDNLDITARMIEETHILARERGNGGQESPRR